MEPLGTIHSSAVQIEGLRQTGLPDLLMKKGRMLIYLAASNKEPKEVGPLHVGWPFGNKQPWMTRDLNVRS